MRRILFTGICLTALCGPAHAQIVVSNPAELFQQIKAYVVQAKQLATTAQQYAAQVQQLNAELQTLEAFVHDPNLGAAMGMMNQAGLGNDLPVNPLAVQSMVSGQAGLMGRVGALGGLVNNSYQSNHIYSPTDNSFASQELVASGNSIAGTQGAAEAVYQDLRNHMASIQALRNTLMTSKDPKAVLDAQGEIQTETLWTANLNSQLAAIQVASQGQADSREQRADEWMNKALDDHMAALTAAGRGL